MGIKTPSAPSAPKPLPDPPKEVDETILTARQRRRSRASSGQGRNTTILTNPQGLGSTRLFNAKTLLGI